MARTKEEMWGKCESVGIDQAQNWVDSGAVSGAELGFISQGIDHIHEKEAQRQYNNDVLKQAKKANHIAWIAAIGSVLSAGAAIMAVYLGS